MPELSSSDAAEVIGVTSQTIRRYVDRGLLPARQEGMKGIIRIDTADLKTFADNFGYRYNDQLAAESSE